jgi:tRNA threonylcarbamoyladenosine biosynthesis protein TsaE
VNAPPLASSMQTSVTHSEEETVAVAKGFASTLKAGDVLLVSGDLGAGKTTFVRGVAEGLGVDPDEVSSPTFTLVHEYRGGRLDLYHADLYRLDRAAAADLGLEEMGVQGGVLAVEWPERLTHGISASIGVDIQWVDDSSRRIIIRTST